MTRVHVTCTFGRVLHAGNGAGKKCKEKGVNGVEGNKSTPNDNKSTRTFSMELVSSHGTFSLINEPTSK